MTKFGDREAILILGMHRSGTSALAGALTLLGARSPKTLMKGNRWNEKGYWESAKLERFHDELLASAESDWKSLKRFPPDWFYSNTAQEFSDELPGLLKREFGDADLFIVKDPRICRFVPFWLDELEKLEIKPKVVLPVRHPVEVAKSLVNRDGLPMEQALLLWLRYCLDAEAATRGVERAFLRYEDLLDDWRKVTSKIALKLSLSWPDAGPETEVEVDEFLTDGLRHNIASVEDLAGGNLFTDWILKAYDCFTLLARDDMDEVKVSECLADLDAIRSSVDYALPSVASMMEKCENTIAGLQKKADETGKLRQKNLQLTSELDEMRYANAVANEALSQTKKSLRKIKAEYKYLDRPSARRIAEIISKSERFLGRVAFLSAPSHLLPGRRRKARRKLRHRREAELIAKSEFFDRDWYLKQYPDVSLARREPLMHYVAAGAKEGRDPGPNFNTAWYLDTNPDVRELGLNPLVHYLLYGRDEGRITSLSDCPVPVEGVGLPEPIVAPPLDSEPNLSVLKTLHFTECDQPDISIIVPVYNEVQYTIRCLEAVAAQQCEWSYEVILMDDCSSDETQSLLMHIPGLRYFRNEHNQGFIANCNRGAELARGEYLVFLNNDTWVQKRWLSALRNTFREHGDVGVVGSMLVYPDGRLQEAGGIIWEDASGWNWGRMNDPFHPRYNFVRDVDYVSGASLMVSRFLFLNLGMFGRDLQNSYYEDTYLAFSTREAGYRVLYQPHSKVVHYEGVTSGTDERGGTKKYQSINKSIFFDRWKGALSSHLANGSDPERASDRAPKGHVLVVDSNTPAPDQDSGSIDMFNLIRILTTLGYRVHFVPLANFLYYGRYTEDLQSMSVECVYAPYYKSLEGYLSERGDVFDFAVLTRVDVAVRSLDVVKKFAPSASTIFYTVDMHGLREAREAELTGDPGKIAAAQETWKRELDIICRSDLSIVLSDYEAELLANNNCSNVEVLPLIRRASEGKATSSYERREGVLFVGGYQHQPNVDAVNWLIESIWPKVCRLTEERGLDPIELKIGGSRMPRWMAEFKGKHVTSVGYIDDLEETFGKARLSVAPLRYGAGLKGKVATSLGYGVPVVGTDIAFEGMPQKNLEVVRCSANRDDELAEKIVDLYYDRGRWEEICQSGPDYVNMHYSIESLSSQVESILQKAKSAK